MVAKKACLTLGPVYYLWEPEKWRDFYLRMAEESAIDRYIIGESVCSKRLHFYEKILDGVVRRLLDAGKEVVFSTLAMVTTEREINATHKLANRADAVLEANDLSALQLLNGRNHSIGPLINVYNGATAQFLARRGATTICLPPELPFSSVKKITAEVRDLSAIEVFAFGRVPLAISARCAHARAKNLMKDNCHFVCGEEPNGLPIRTLDNKDFLNLNGIQTLSHSCQVLCHEVLELMRVGVNRFRLSPQDCDMVKVSRIYQQLITETIDAPEAAIKLEEICGAMPMSNGFLASVAGAQWVNRQNGL